MFLVYARKVSLIIKFDYVFCTWAWAAALLLPRWLFLSVIKNDHFELIIFHLNERSMPNHPVKYYNTIISSLFSIPMKRNSNTVTCKMIQCNDTNHFDWNWWISCAGLTMNNTLVTSSAWIRLNHALVFWTWDCAQLDAAYSALARFARACSRLRYVCDRCAALERSSVCVRFCANERLTCCSIELFSLCSKWFAVENYNTFQFSWHFNELNGRKQSNNEQQNVWYLENYRKR